MSERVIIEKQALPENIEELCLATESALQRFNLPEVACQELMMALGEAITNVVFYAYGEDKGNVRVEVGMQSDETVNVELIDHGREFNPTLHPEPDLNVPIEERPIGGMGIQMMRNFTDALIYRRENGRNHFLFIKKFGGSCA